MRRELERKPIERWPTWFDTKGDLRHTLLPLGFEHGDGWFDLLWRLRVQSELRAVEGGHMWSTSANCPIKKLSHRNPFRSKDSTFGGS
jgi:hypothetical protein